MEPTLNSVRLLPVAVAVEVVLLRQHLAKMVGQAAVPSVEDLPVQAIFRLFLRPKEIPAVMAILYLLTTDEAVEAVAEQVHLGCQPLPQPEVTGVLVQHQIFLARQLPTPVAAGVQ
jgi:hypothetical protein